MTLVVGMTEHPATAQDHLGGWTSYVGRDPAGNLTSCLVSLTQNDRTIGFLRRAGQSWSYVAFQKPTWRIPPGKKAQVVFKSGMVTMQGAAIGVGSALLLHEATADALNQFHDLVLSTTANVTFAGSESPWSFSTYPADKAFAWFQQCSAALPGQQPFDQ